jgi:hypothetical protein
MRAKLLLRQRVIYEDGSFEENKIWLVPSPVSPSKHSLKYSLAYIIDGQDLSVTTTKGAKAIIATLRGAKAPTYSNRSRS